MNTPFWVPALSRLTRALPFGRYRLMDALLAHPREPFWAKMPSSVGGAQFWCNLRDSKQRDVCILGNHEPVESLLLPAMLKQGMTFVDVGANWGYFTLMAQSCVGESGSLMAIEADPRMFEVLRRNVEKNAFSNVKVVQKAIADRAGKLKLQGFDELTSNFGVSSLAYAESNKGTALFDVDSIGLDNLLTSSGFGTVDFLKMDIEGAEVLAFAGMKEGLASHRYSRMLVELHPWAYAAFGSSLSSFLSIPLSAGYRAWWLNDTEDVNRRLLYGEQIPLTDLVTAFDGKSRPDERGHILWVAPGVALPEWLT